jgi:hypothetical protein
MVTFPCAPAAPQYSAAANASTGVQACITRFITIYILFFTIACHVVRQGRPPHFHSRNIRARVGKNCSSRFHPAGKIKTPFNPANACTMKVY